MEAKPKFARIHDGSLRLGYTVDANQVARQNRTRKPGPALSPNIVHTNAVMEAQRLGGDSKNELFVLGCYKLQFGSYRGQTFRWLVENGLGYSAWMVDGMRGERPMDNPLSRNKFSFKKFLESFEAGREAVAMKEKERLRKTRTPATSTSQSTTTTRSPLASLLTERRFSPQKLQSRVKHLLASRPQVTASPAKGDIGDDELLSAVEELESSQLHGDVSMATSPKRKKTSTSTESQESAEAISGTATPMAPVFDTVKSTSSGFQLPSGWCNSLPKADHKWISKALFKTAANGKVELDWSRVDKLWWSSPSPPLICHQVPHPDRYFAHPLLLWMPRRLFRVRLMCPQPHCRDVELTSAGIYPHVRQVIAIDGYYNLASEYLECRSCKKKVISWSCAVIQQLDIGHRLQFPAVLIYRYACDVRVVRLFRTRGLGNSATQLTKKIREQHSSSWMQKVLHYLTDCAKFKSSLVSQPVFQDPPPMMSIPTYKWFITMYCNDVLQRIDEVKATITSTFGTILKMDSTKKVVKKLAGHSAKTASWATNVGNEYGQVLMSVLTASEGVGLAPMVEGLIKRYTSAGVPPPSLLYVDRDCCGPRSSEKMFIDWPNLRIRLDVWHFMRRIASGCTTDSHQLYATFMSRVSGCIFEWSAEDLERLKMAKCEELRKQHLDVLSDGDVIRRITKKEMSLHCRRRTRGIEDTTIFLNDLLTTFSGDQGLDTLGVPLLDKKRIWDIWESQKKHVACIQDPDDIQLYVQTGQLKKGGLMLPIFRCARGSTSLESFHLHLNRFIPGTSASDLHFQAYLLEGLLRWNEDRARAACTEATEIPQCYSGLVQHAVNNLSQSVLGRELTSYTPPQKYTGELIGVEYLFSQTGQVLQDYTLDNDGPEPDGLKIFDDDGDDDEGFGEDDDMVEDQTIALVETLPATAIAASTANTSTSTVKTARHQLVNMPDVSTDIEEPSREFLESLTAKFHQKDQQTTVSPAVDPLLQETATPTVVTSETREEHVTPTKDPSHGESVGPDNIPGYDRVEALAEYLVQLKTGTSPINNEQADRIISLWNRLLPYDRKAVKFSPRFKTKPVQDRFKQTKKQGVAPGVETTKRGFLGQNAGPAQWPDCNRYVECIISKLCDWFPSRERSSEKRTSLRWTLICRAYKNIRSKILNNAKVMEKTSVQLVEINQTTLTQWYNKRAKQQECEILRQGLTVTQPPVQAKEALLAALEKTSIPVPQAVQPFIFTLPPNTAGHAKLSKAAHLSAPVCFLVPREQNVAEESLPKTTKWYHKQKLQKGAMPRKYVKKSDVIMCRKCNKPRSKPEHSQYFGNWYCVETSPVSYEDWRADLEKKRYKKKKTQ